MLVKTAVLSNATMAQKQREVLEPTLSRVLTPAIIFTLGLVFIGYYYSYLIAAML
jgi:hypothetical protein